MDTNKILAQIPFALKETQFPFPNKITGKVRDSYIIDDKRIIIVTDRISAFDRVLGTLPFKGEILQAVSNYWFQQTEDIIPNHIIDTPDPNAIIVRNCRTLPVEVIVRGYITGSLWRAYQTGEREMYGIRFAEGLQQNQAFEQPIITPSTKAEQGEHDAPLTPREIIEGGWVEAGLWRRIEEIALALFHRGQEIALEKGLILVDTKYEFGLWNEELILIDEVHTPDSSRYWYEDSYQTGTPRQLDKEYIRQWLIELGFMGEGVIPELTHPVICEAVERYLTIYRLFLNHDLETRPGNVYERLEGNLRHYGILV